MQKNPKANSVMTQWRRANKEKADKYNKDYYAANVPYMKKKALKWRKDNPEKVKVFARKASLKTKGWTLEEYNSAKKKQNNRCKVCKKPNNQKNRPLHADHDHDSGKKRDLLCSACNTGIGSFRDNPKLLESAAKYLRRHGR